MTARDSIPNLADNLFQQARDLARVHVAGSAAQREIDRPFFVKVQDIAHQLLVMANDNDEETRTERMRLMQELVKIADAKVNA